MKRMEVGNRLRKTREDKNLSRNEVATKVSIGTTTLQQWETGSREASLETIEELANLYKVSPQYLIFGDNTDYEAPQLTPAPTISPANDEYVYIPAYDIEASAGHGSFVDGENARKHLAFRKRWVQARGLKPKDLSAIFTKGDSMEPTIADGAAIVIDKSRNQVIDGKIYVLRINNDLYVKRVQRTPDGLRLISDNRIYDPLDVIPSDFTPDQFAVCGQVIHASYDLPD